MRMGIGQLDNIFPVISVRFALGIFQDQRAIGTIGLLKPGVAVEPVGAILNDRKPVGKGFTRLDAVIADLGHTILLVGQNEPMPVN